MPSNRQSQIAGSQGHRKPGLGAHRCSELCSVLHPLGHAYVMNAPRCGKHTTDPLRGRPLVGLLALPHHRSCPPGPLFCSYLLLPAEGYGPSLWSNKGKVLEYAPRAQGLDLNRLCRYGGRVSEFHTSHFSVSSAWKLPWLLTPLQLRVVPFLLYYMQSIL